MNSRREDLDQERAKLERLIGTSNSEAWKSIEKIADTHKRLCERAVMQINHGSFERDALDAAFTRGEHKVWAWLANVRESAPEELAAIERKLAALRKEAHDGQERQQGEGETVGG